MKVDGWGYIEHMIRDCEDIVEVLNEVIDYDTFAARRVLHKSVIYSLLNLEEKIKNQRNIWVNYPPTKDIFGQKMVRNLTRNKKP